MEELISRVSEQLGVPEFLVERSARARAQAQGVAAEEVLQAWAGGEGVAAAPAEEVEEEVPAVPAEQEAAEPEVPEEEPAEEEPAEEEIEEPVAARAEDLVVEEHEGAVLVTASAGLRERALESFPRWLMMAFLVIPAYALFYTLVYAGGPGCGEAGRLAVDPETGRILNCDGTPFTPEGGPATGPGADLIAMGRGLYAASPGACASCHGAQGQGQGRIPDMFGVVETFSACDAHLEWVALGSQGWPEATYGAQGKPVGGGGVMPAFGNQLTEEQLQAVVLFERVQHGGQGLDEALVDCGLVEPEEEAPEGQGEGTTETEEEVSEEGPGEGEEGG